MLVAVLSVLVVGHMIRKLSGNLAGLSVTRNMHIHVDKNFYSGGAVIVHLKPQVGADTHQAQKRLLALHDSGDSHLPVSVGGTIPTR